MNTNLLALITFVVVTNWTTVSKTIPERPPDPTFLVHYPAIHNQEGIVVSNVYVNFTYEGSTNTVLVKSTRLSETNLSRSLWEGREDLQFPWRPIELKEGR